LAKNIVANGLAKRCELQVAYAIGVDRPVGLFVNTFGTGDDEYVKGIIKNIFDLRPKAIIEYLDLRKPIYEQTAAYGHFGRNNFTWENVVNFKGASNE
jgi:S-adenosylmethionine synthetase